MAARFAQARAPGVAPTPAGGGFVNAAANVGAGTGLSYRDIIANTINLRTIKAGLGVNITTVGDVINIAAGAYTGLYWLNPIISFYNPGPGLPVGPAVGDRYIATATANGWTIRHVYEWDGALWVDTAPLEGMTVYDKGTDTLYSYTGALWVSPETTTVANVGTGTGNVYRDKTGEQINLKTIKQGAGITVTNNADDVTITCTITGESTTVANVGTGTGQSYRDMTGAQINLKTIKQGAGITVTNNADDVTITCTVTGESTTVANVGTGTGQSYRDMTGAQINLKTIKQGAGITVTNNADDVTITCTVTGLTLQAGSGIQIYPLTGGSTAVSANHTFTFDNRYLQSFWANAAVFTSSDWDLAVGVGLRGLAANNATNAFKYGVRGEFDILMSGVANNANAVGMLAEGNGQTAQIKIDNANNITVSFTGQANVVLGVGASSAFLRIHFDERWVLSFEYRLTGTDPWTVIVAYSGSAIVNFKDTITLSLLSSPVIAGTYNYIPQLTLNITPDNDPRVFTLTDAATVALDASRANVFTVTLAGNRTLGAPTNPMGGGQVIHIRVMQDGTGSRTLAYNAIYRFPGGGTPILQTQANAQDILTFMYHAADMKWDFIGKNSVTSQMVLLTDAATIAVNASLGSKFKITLGGNRTLGNPTNPAGGGQLLLIKVSQDGTGGRTLAYDTKYRFSTGLPSPTITAGINKFDYIGFIYNATDDKWDFIALVQGFN
jgi:hypothetical protein